MSGPKRREIRCMIGHKLGEVVRVNGEVTYQTKCKSCHAFYEISLSPSGVTVVKVDAISAEMVRSTSSHPH